MTDSQGGRHLAIDDAIIERVSLYAAGAATDDERVGLESHILGCEVCAAELRTYEPVIEGLAATGGELEPSAELLNRVRERAQARPASPVWQRWQDVATTEDVYVQAAVDATWEATGIDGVEARKLSVDRAGDRVTMLVRMAAGAVYPRHRHRGVEECYVIEGDLWTDDLGMGAGDFMRVEAGSVHPPQSTRNGCVLMIVSSLQDEIL